MTDNLQSAGIPILEKNETPMLPTTLDATPDLIEEAKPESQTEAMHSGQARTFLGKQLAPFDWRRQEAANAMGLKILKLSPQEAEEFDGRYDGMAGDAAIVVWLCTLTPSEVAKAIRLPIQATEQRLKWAEKNVKGIGSAAHLEMTAVYAEIISAYMSSVAEPVETPGKPEQQENLQSQ